MSNTRVERMRWRQQVWETVDGAAWFCDDCGWAGLDHHSIEAAQSEADRHVCKQAAALTPGDD